MSAGSNINRMGSWLKPCPFTTQERNKTMRIIPIDIEIKLAVCASDFDEAVDAVKRGLAEGRYVNDAKIRFAASIATKAKPKKNNKKGA